MNYARIDLNRVAVEKTNISTWTAIMLIWFASRWILDEKVVLVEPFIIPLKCRFVTTEFKFGRLLNVILNFEKKNEIKHYRALFTNFTILNVVFSMEENVPQMMINLLVMILLAITQFFEGRQNDWTTRMDYLRKIQVCHMLWYKTDHVHYSSTTSCSPTVLANTRRIL